MLCFTRQKQLHSTYIFFHRVFQKYECIYVWCLFKKSRFLIKVWCVLKIYRSTLQIKNNRRITYRILYRKNFKTFYVHLRCMESPWNMDMLFKWENLYQIPKNCPRIIQTYISRRYRSFTAITFDLYLKPCE